MPYLSKAAAGKGRVHEGRHERHHEPQERSANGMRTNKTITWTRLRRPVVRTGYSIALIGVGALAMYLAAGRPGQPPVMRDPSAAQASQEEEGERDQPRAGARPPTTQVQLSEEKQKASGLRVEPAGRSTLTETVRLTGKLAVNEDHIARIHPLVEGRIHKIEVQFGDRVKAGQVLAVIDSQQVGHAKLELFKAMQETRLARVNYQWQQTIRENTQALIARLNKGLLITDLERQFADRPMGDYRQQLLAAYAELFKARADHKRLAGLAGKGVVPEKRLIAAKSSLDVAQATFSGAIEQIGFTAMRNELAAKQELEKDNTAEAIDRELLGILGYHDIQPADIDPAVQKEAISHYELKAPFDGTVIERNVALLDQVSPTTEMFTVANFSTVWVQADVYERYLPLLANLANQVVRFRSESYPDRDFKARIFYLGSQVDAKTRTADMRAIADNSDRRLKPGMFVELELPAQSVPGVLQVPASALQTYQKATFVFVRKGGNRFERRDVRLGRKGNGAVEITDGLNEGEPVVVEGGFALKSELLSGLMGEGD